MLNSGNSGGGARKLWERSAKARARAVAAAKASAKKAAATAKKQAKSDKIKAADLPKPEAAPTGAASSQDEFVAHLMDRSFESSEHESEKGDAAPATPVAASEHEPENDAAPPLTPFGQSVQPRQLFGKGVGMPGVQKPNKSTRAKAKAKATPSKKDGRKSPEEIAAMAKANKWKDRMFF